ncbi:hypothetical protein AC628_26895 [Bradyrhizobium sp. NAS96.2]|nr:hypothetical protein AC628_26895 [Bradyrhizobium sp. NAS96.2]
MRVAGADGVSVEYAWEPKTWYLIRDDAPYLDVLIRGHRAQAESKAKLELLDDPAPEGARWQRWDLEAELAYNRRLGEVSLALKVPKGCTLRCYIIPTLLLGYRDVIAMVEDIELELGITAAWDMVTERPERTWSRRAEGGQTIAPSELVGLVIEELPAALSIRRDPFAELGPHARRGVPLAENAIISHWAVRRHSQLLEAATLVTTELSLLRLKGTRSNSEGRQKKLDEEIERLVALEFKLTELSRSLTRLRDEVELMTVLVHPGPLFQRDYRLRRLLRAFAPRISESFSAIESSRSHFPPVFLNSLWALWGAVWLAKEFRRLGFTGACYAQATDVVSSCSWRFQRDDIVVELDYEPGPVFIDYQELPPAHDRTVPALEWAARNQELDPDRPFLGSEPRCAPDYIIRITTAHTKCLVVGDACLASPKHHGKGQDKTSTKPYTVERYRRTLGWATGDLVVRCHPMGGFVVFPPPAAAWQDLQQIPGASDCTLLCPGPQQDPEASRRLENMLLMVVPQLASSLALGSSLANGSAASQHAGELLFSNI